uniref:Uncharacterized protein n=1 Tax=Arundo donax TaxID=35708 RepID=A0A0A9CQY5_ARUDO
MILFSGGTTQTSFSYVMLLPKRRKNLTRSVRPHSQRHVNQLKFQIQPNVMDELVSFEALFHTKCSVTWDQKPVRFLHNTCTS